VELIHRFRVLGFGLGGSGMTNRFPPGWTVIVPGSVVMAAATAVHCVAADRRSNGIGVHAISPGPLATRAAPGIPGFVLGLAGAGLKAQARERVDIDDVGVATASLADDATRPITGQVQDVDGGFPIVD
jgi:enoyl-[acyl-carrier protein] reductase I